MKAKDIKVGHIYYVDYDPVRKGEFDRNHLAIVLKKNTNRITFVTIPLTSSSKGDGVNKYLLEITSILPKRLQSKPTYAVYDQVKTVNASRFEPIYDDTKTHIFDVEVPKPIMDELFERIIRDLLYDIDEERRACIYKNLSSSNKRKGNVSGKK